MAEPQVLVVGGRTTGLLMAAELARHGVGVRIIDKSPGIDPHCRATFLHSRTLEILGTLGIAAAMVEVGQPLLRYHIYADGEFIGSEEQAAVDSPFAHGVALSQAQIEACLEQHLGRLGVSVERNTQLTALDQTADCVRATLVDADGRQQTLEIPWLVGCDGAHSTVRHLTEEGFPGTADPYPYVLADVVVDAPLDPGDAYQFLSDEGDLFLFILNEGRRFVCANEPKGSRRSDPPTLAEVQQMVAERSGQDYRLSDPRWLARFHIHYRLAPHYRHGRTFLAGDAAHVHSLVGGQGMNTGMQDAHNLAWKLALVLGGIAPETWLETYEIERRGVAADVIAATKAATEQAEMFAGLSHAQREKLRKHMFVPESEKMRARQHAEELDLDYRSSPICFEPMGEFEGGPHAGSRAPDAGPIVAGGRSCNFFDLLSAPRHLVVFFGASAAEAALEIAAAARAALGAYGEWMDVYVVRTRAFELDLPAKVTLVEDAGRTLHGRFGVDGPCLYLVRPDGYVAYRSRRLDSLAEYVQRALG